METPVLIIAAVLFVLGMLVRKYPNLIAGYNTMTAEQKKNVDVKGPVSYTHLDVYKRQAHDYKTKVDALFLKREYLTQVQLKDYLRQEIFRVTENIVAIQQKYRVVRNIVLDMDIPDFLWESGYWKGFVFQSAV